MGLPPGHVTHTPHLTRTAQLRILGNGVVPHQARCALHHLIKDMHAVDGAHAPPTHADM
ncbi:hypothetical protein [Embleya sp. NPDC020630]|uniref:hypothetical protein n=1 Tax=Embleya sp. NPDC020630 TaxID=3363979 RepID=UPI0037957B8D